MAKKLLQAIQECDHLSDHVKAKIQDLYDEMPKSTPAQKSESPKTEITQELVDRAKKHLVDQMYQGTHFVLNPLTRKWIKAESPAGKLLRFMH